MAGRRENKAAVRCAVCKIVLRHMAMNDGRTATLPRVPGGAARSTQPDSGGTVLWTCSVRPVCAGMVQGGTRLSGVSASSERAQTL